MAASHAFAEELLNRGVPLRRYRESERGLLVHTPNCMPWLRFDSVRSLIGPVVTLDELPSALDELAARHSGRPPCCGHRRNPTA